MSGLASWIWESAGLGNEDSPMVKYVQFRIEIKYILNSNSSKYREFLRNFDKIV